MCDDYDTDFDSDPDEFDRCNLRDDIQRINLALAADSDDEPSDEEDDDAEEEESGLSKFSHFKAPNLTDPTTSISADQSNSVQPPYPEPTVIDLEEIPTYTELKTRTSTDCQPSTTHFLNSYNAEQGTEQSLLNSAEGEISTISSSWTVEHELYNFTNVQKDFREDTQGNNITGVSRLSRLDREVLQHCLARNRETQTQLIREIRLIDLCLNENKRKKLDLAQVRYNHEADDENDLKALPSLHKFSSPYFKDSEGNGPPDNEDAKHYRSLMKINPYDKKPTTWNKNEKADLAEGVRMQNLKLKLAPLLMRLKELESLAGGLSIIEIENLKQKIRKVKETPPEELEENLDGLDWDKLSCEYLSRRSAMECKLEWCHFGHPRVNRKPWTKTEDKTLLKLAKGKGHLNWNELAQTLQTNRTPLECFKRYQRSLNKEFIRSKWTPEEDKQLIELVRTFGISNWSRIADFMEGRVGEQCMHRYMKACRPNKKGRWSEDESQKLKEAVEKVGRNWEKVAEYVPGRTGTQCRERYVNIMDPNLKKGGWSDEEDEKLLNLIQKYGEGNWSKVARELAPRTDNQCWRRWHVLRRNESINYRINTVRKKREMVSNFVGRRKERPTLTPMDLDIQDLPVIIRDERKKIVSQPSVKSTNTTPVFKLKPKNVLKPAKPDTKKTPKQKIVVKPPKEPYVPWSDHSYAAALPKNVQKVKDVEKTVNESNHGESNEIKSEVLVLSSDDDWDDSEVLIDESILGTRSSARKTKKSVSYVEKDEKDISSDEVTSDEDDVTAVKDDVTVKVNKNDVTVKDDISIKEDVTTVDKDQIEDDDKADKVEKDRNNVAADVKEITMVDKDDKDEDVGLTVKDDVAIDKDDIIDKNDVGFARDDVSIDKDNASDRNDDFSIDNDDVTSMGIDDVSENKDDSSINVDCISAVGNDITTDKDDITAHDKYNVPAVKGDMPVDPSIKDDVTARDKGDVTAGNGDLPFDSFGKDDTTTRSKDDVTDFKDDLSVDSSSKDDVTTRDKGDVTAVKGDLPVDPPSEDDITALDKSVINVNDEEDVITMEDNDVSANDITEDKDFSNLTDDDDVIDDNNDDIVDKHDVAIEQAVFTFDQQDIPVGEVLIPVDNAESEVDIPLVSTDGNDKQGQRSEKTKPNPSLKKTRKKRKKRTLKPESQTSNKKETNTSREEQHDGSFLFLSIPSFPSMMKKRKAPQKQKKTKKTVTASKQASTPILPNTKSIASTVDKASITPRIPTPVQKLTPVRAITPVQIVRTNTPQSNNPNITFKAVPTNSPIVLRPTDTNSRTNTSTPPNSSPTVPSASIQPSTSTTAKTVVTSSNAALRNKRAIAPKPADGSVPNLASQTPQTAKRRRKNAKKIRNEPSKENVVAKAPTHQANVAPFSLLLQAFNIDVAAVLMKLNPGAPLMTTTSKQSSNETNSASVTKTASNIQSKKDIVSPLPLVSRKPLPLQTAKSDKARDVGPRTVSTAQNQISNAPSSTQRETDTAHAHKVTAAPLSGQVLNNNKDLLPVAKALSNQCDDKRLSKTPGVKPDEQRTKLGDSESQTHEKDAQPAVVASLPVAQKSAKPLDESESKTTENKDEHTTVETSSVVQKRTQEFGESESKTSENKNEHPTVETSLSVAQQKTLTFGELESKTAENKVKQSQVLSTKSHPKEAATSHALTSLPPDVSIPAGQVHSAPSVTSVQSSNHTISNGPSSNKESSTMNTTSSPQTKTKNPKEFRSPSRRKSSKPRKLIEMGSPTASSPASPGGQKSPASPDTTEPAGNSAPKEVVSPSHKNTDRPPPSIPPLPPTLTTLKGLRNILSMKEQLQKLAAKIDSVPSSPKKRKSSSTERREFSPSRIPGSNNKANKDKPKTHGTTNILPNRPARQDAITPVDVIRTENDEELVVVHINAPTVLSESPPEEQININPRTVTEQQTTRLDNRVVHTDVPPSEGSSFTSPSGRSTIDPYVKFSLYRKAPEYKLLLARFQSLFLWPMFMSDVAVSSKLIPTVHSRLASAVDSSEEDASSQEGITNKTKTSSKRIKKKTTQGPSKRRKSSNTQSINKKNLANKRSQDDDSTDDSESDDVIKLDAGDDEYRPQFNFKSDKVTPSRILRPRKRDYKSALQTNQDSNSESDDCSTTKKKSQTSLLRNDVTPATTQESRNPVAPSGHVVVTKKPRKSGGQVNKRKNSKQSRTLNKEKQGSRQSNPSSSFSLSSIALNVQQSLGISNDLQQEAQQSNVPSTSNSSVMSTTVSKRQGAAPSNSETNAAESLLSLNSTVVPKTETQNNHRQTCKETKGGP